MAINLLESKFPSSPILKGFKVNSEVSHMHNQLKLLNVIFSTQNLTLMLVGKFKGRCQACMSSPLLSISHEKNWQNYKIQEKGRSANRRWRVLVQSRKTQSKWKDKNWWGDWGKVSWNRMKGPGQWDDRGLQVQCDRWCWEHRSGWGLYSRYVESPAQVLLCRGEQVCHTINFSLAKTERRLFFVPNFLIW